MLATILMLIGALGDHAISTYRIMVHIPDEWFDNDLLSEFQGAFNKGRRCEDSIFTLKGVCAIQKSKKGN